LLGHFLAGKSEHPHALRNALTGLVALLGDGTSVLFTTRENEMANFDNDSKAYRSICEYEFLFVEP